MSTIFPADVTAALKAMDKEKIRAVEFEAGLTLLVFQDDEWTAVLIVNKARHGRSEHEADISTHCGRALHCFSPIATCCCGRGAGR